MNAAATKAELPAPLVSADVDISGLDGFMLNIQRLFSSELWALSTGDEFKAAIALWGRAWQQSPPGSLPNDDRVLAAFSGAGRAWRKVHAVALRGFVECSDGRLYHRVLCEDVLNAHAKRLAFKDRTKAATAARQQRNAGRDGERNDDDERQRHETATPNATSVQGQGQGRRQAASQQPRGRAEVSKSRFDEVMAACSEALGDMAPADPVIGPIILLLDRGAKLEEVLTILRSEAQRPRRTPIRTWKLWAEKVAEQLAAGPPPAVSRADPADPADPVFHLGGGFTAKLSSMRTIVARGHRVPQWGPGLDDVGCRVPERYRDELRALMPRREPAGAAA